MNEIVQAVMIQLKQFQIFLWMSSVSALAIFLCCMWLCRKVTVTSKRMRFLVVFFDLGMDHVLGLSMVYLKLMLVLSVALCFRQAPFSHYIVFGLCTLFLVVVLMNLTQGVIVVISNLLLAVGLAVSGLLRSYVVEVNPDLGYILVLAMMNLCIVAYSLYLALSELQMIMEEKRMIYEEAEPKEEE
ncbi:MAG: hypothetical protein ACLTKI_07160 [Lachnospiraceae bacterium]